MSNKLLSPSENDIKKIYHKADEYAKLSIDHTLDYGGWEQGNGDNNRQQKLERILLGQIGQLWLKRFCEINQIPYIDDYTDHETADEYDIIVFNKRLDTKVTRAGVVKYQVNPALRNKQIDYFCFLQTGTYDITPTVQIVPIGIISATDYWQYSEHIRYGQQIPGTRITQKFRSGTHILTDTKRLTDFYTFMLDTRRAFMIDVIRDDIVAIVAQKQEQLRQEFGVEIQNLNDTIQSLKNEPVHNGFDSYYSYDG